MSDKKNQRSEHAAADAALVEVFRQGFADGAAGNDPAPESHDGATSEAYHDGYQQGGTAADKALREQRHDVYSRHSSSVRAADFIGAVAVAMTEFGNIPVMIKVGPAVLSLQNMAITKGRDDLGNRVLVVAIPAPKKK